MVSERFKGASMTPWFIGFVALITATLAFGLWLEATAYRKDSTRHSRKANSGSITPTNLTGEID